MKYIKTFEHYDNTKAWNWYGSFKNRYYPSVDKAKDDITHVVNHNNKQFSKVFGEDKVDDIIDLFNFEETPRGVKIIPKKRKNTIPKPELKYETNNELIDKQKNLWTDIRGIEFGRYLSRVRYIDIDYREIYGTEQTNESIVLKLMKALRNGIELPPILLDYDYGILDGHHRWEAAKRLKIKQIPAIIYHYPDEESIIECSINENNTDVSDIILDIAYWEKIGRNLKYFNLIKGQQMSPPMYLENELNLKKGTFSKEWVYTMDSPEEEEWIVWLVYRLIGISGAKDTFDFLFNNLIKNNPELEDINCIGSIDKYHIIFGATSRMQFADIKEFVEIGGGMARSIDYKETRDRVDILARKLGYKNICQYVINAKGLEKLEKILLQRLEL